MCMCVVMRRQLQLWVWASPPAQSIESVSGYPSVWPLSVAVGTKNDAEAANRRAPFDLLLLLLKCQLASYPTANCATTPTAASAPAPAATSTA